MKKTIMIIMAVVGVGLVCADSEPVRPRTRPKLASPRSLVQLNRTLVEALDNSDEQGGAIDLLRKRLAKNARVAPVELVYDAIDQLLRDIDVPEPVARKLKKYQTALVDGNISHAVMIDKRERPEPASLSGSTRPVAPSGTGAATAAPREVSLAVSDREMDDSREHRLAVRPQDVSPIGCVGRLEQQQAGKPGHSQVHPEMMSHTRPQAQYMMPDGAPRPQPRQQNMYYRPQETPGMHPGGRPGHLRPAMAHGSQGRPQQRPHVERGDWPKPPASRPTSRPGQAGMRPTPEWEQRERQNRPPAPAMIAALLERFKDQPEQREHDQEYSEAREPESDLSIQDIRMLVAQSEQVNGRPAAHDPRVDVARIQGSYEQEPRLGLLPGVPTSSPLLHPEETMSAAPQVGVHHASGTYSDRISGREGVVPSGTKRPGSLEDIVKEALEKMPVHEQSDTQMHGASQPSGTAPMALVHEKGTSVFMPHPGGYGRPDLQSAPSPIQSAAGRPTGLHAIPTSGEAYVPSTGKPSVASSSKVSLGAVENDVLAQGNASALLDSSGAGLPHIAPLGTGDLGSNVVAQMGEVDTSGEAMQAEQVEATGSTISIAGFDGFGSFHSPTREMPPEEFLDHIQMKHDVPREQLSSVPENINALSVGPVHAPSREFDQNVVQHDPSYTVNLMQEKIRREELLRPATNFLQLSEEKPKPKPKAVTRPKPQPKPEDMTLTTKQLVVECDATIRGSASVGGCLDLGGFGVFDACSSRSSSDCREREKLCPQFFLGSDDACALSNRLHVRFSSPPILFIDTQKLASSTTPLLGVLPIDTMFSGRLKLVGCSNALVNEPAIKVIPVSIGDTTLAVPTWVDMNILFSVDLGTSFRGPVTAVGGFEEGRDYGEVVETAIQSGLVVYPPSVYFSKSECGTLNVLLKLTFFQLLVGATGSTQAATIARAAEAAVGLLTSGSVVIFYDGVPRT